MKLGYVLCIMGMLFLIVGCAPENNAEMGSSVQAAPVVKSEGALSTVAPTETAVSVEMNVQSETADFTSTPDISMTTSETISTSVTTGEPVAPVSVDLGKITPAPPVNETPIEMPKPGVPGQGENMLQKVQNDLAARLDRPLDDIQSVSAEEVEWSDSSLGCPDGDFAYMTVITPGFKIILSVDDTKYEYHTDLQGHFVLCVDGKPAKD